MASMQVLQGLGVSEGVAIGRAICLETRNQEVYRFPLLDDQLEAEIDRFRSAAQEAQEEVQRLGRRVGHELGDELGGIFEAHSLMLSDPSLLGAIERRIQDEKVNAEWAVLETTADLRNRFASLDEEHFRERGEDLQDVGRHLLRALQGISHHDLSEIEGDVIVIADDLTPSDAVRLGRQGVVGFAIEVGGQTSHTAIIAHSLDIPLVAGLPGITRLAAQDDPVIVDGTTGSVILHPTADILERDRLRQTAQKASQRAWADSRELEAVTRDGVSIQLMANIDLSEELEDALRYGAQGVGLYRSEFLYIEQSPEVPDEEDHYEVYRRLLEKMAPSPVVIRTYDLGGRKLAREVMESREENPVLGLRGIRLTLARPRIFRTQLRGLLRAGRHGELWVLLPLVSTVDEVRSFRAFVATVMEELRSEGIPFNPQFQLGVMIEVPSAVMVADHLAREVDFFAIGTNDLIQYSLAVDRNNEHVADLYRPLHPALLRMIRRVIDEAEKAQIPVSVCGEMAADPRLASVLVGLGIRRLSLSPRRLPLVKEKIRAMDCSELARHLDLCSDLVSASDIERYLDRCGAL